MKNRSLSIRKYEVIIVILLLLIISIVLLKCILNGVNLQKFKTMRNSARSIRNIAIANAGSFNEIEKIYLGELMDDKLLTEVKSPVSKGNCSLSESYIKLVNGTYEITLKCGDYVLEDASFIGDNKGIFYRVSDWSESKENNDNDEIVLYNFLKNGKEKYSNYYEDSYFIYMINKDYKKSYKSIEEINDSIGGVITKKFYREKDIYEN